MPFGQSRRKSQKNGANQKRKATTKDPQQTEHRLRAVIECATAKLAAIERAKCPPTEQATRTAAREEDGDALAKDYGDQRVVIKFFYEIFKSPPEEEWKGR